MGVMVLDGGLQVAITARDISKRVSYVFVCYES